MATGLTGELAAAALVMGLLSLWMVRRYLPLGVAVGVVAVKFAIPLVFFARYYDGTWTFLDDLWYADQGRILLAGGFDPFTVLFRRDGLSLLVQMSQGLHILYGWWNLLAQFFFGPHYHAAVFLNVALTFYAGVLLFRTARLAGFGEQYAQGLLVFFLLHWELVAWSSFINAKDLVVLGLSVSAFYHFLQLMMARHGAGKRVLHIAALALVVAACLWIRFYVSVLLLGTFGIWAVLKWRGGWKKPFLMAFAGVGVLVVLPSTIRTDLLTVSPTAATAGVLQFALTPRPWSIEPAYTFLLVPSVIHWLLFAPAVVGGYLLWRRSPVGVLMVMYLGVTFLFYALVPELDGPRYRVQVLFIWGWMQYHAIYQLLRVVARRRAPAPPGGGALRTPRRLAEAA